MNVVIETERLYLRELKEEDAKSIFLLNNDPDVIRYTGDLPFEDTKAAKDFLQTYDPYSKYGFGRWAVLLKKDDAFLGWCGLKYTPEKNEHDLGFRFFKRFWNKGYATESSKASLHFGFTRCSIECILGRAAHENIASIRVLQKSGMSFLREQEFGTHPGVVYKIDAEDSANP